MSRLVIVSYVVGGVLAVGLPAAAVTSARDDAYGAAVRTYLIGATVHCWNAALGTVRERGIGVVHWGPGTPPSQIPPAGVVDLVGGGWTERGLLGTTRSGQRIEYSCRLRQDGALAHPVSVSVG